MIKKITIPILLEKSGQNVEISRRMLECTIFVTFDKFLPPEQPFLDICTPWKYKNGCYLRHTYDIIILFHQSWHNVEICSRILNNCNFLLI